MKKVALTLTAVLFVLSTVIAQDNAEAKHNVSISIPTVAILDVEDEDGEATTINLSPNVSALEAGAAVDFSEATDNRLWLNYTSVVSDDENRSISAKMTGDDLPTGIKLMLAVGAASTGEGQLGEAASGNIELKSNNSEVVSSIGSCYTNSGHQQGHQLTYSLSMNNSEYDDLVAKSYNVEVVYTITDN